MKPSTSPIRGTTGRARESHDLDLTGVDPLRIAEIRRRVAVVRSYLSLVEPDDSHRKAHARDLGLSVNQFLALVRAWSQNEEASALSGSGAAKGSPRPGGRRNLPSVSKRAAYEAIAAADAETSLVAIVEEVAERCDELGVAPPSRSTIWNMLMEVRRASVGTGGSATVISRCHVRLPVSDGEGLDFPSVVLAVEEEGGAIVFAALGHVPWKKALEATIASGSISGHLRIDEEIFALLHLPDKTGLEAVKATVARTATARVLGRGIGSLDLIYQRSRARQPQDMLLSKMGAPLSCADAFALLGEQIDSHNAMRKARPPVVPGRDQLPAISSRKRRKLDGGDASSSDRF